MTHPLQNRAVGAGGRIRLIAATLAAATMTALAQPVLAQTFQAPDIDVDEGEKAIFKVTLPLPYDGGFRWKYTTENDTATSGNDYTAASGYLTIYPATNLTGSVEVETAEDDVADDGETFKLKLYDFETKGFSRDNPDQWTNAYAFSNIPTEKTMTATINE